MSGVPLGGLAALGVMYAAFLLVGWLATRKLREDSASELLVAGRAMPLWVATLTMTATWVDGGYLLGTAEGTFSGLAAGFQGGFFFGLSLIVGGLFFAAPMRRRAYTTLIDPFDDRFGPRWAAVLSVPAMLGEAFWSAELLLALGVTFGVLLNLDLTTSVLLSAAVVTFYTMLGGMWAVAYTDVFQLGLIPLGLLTALPFALEHVGGLDRCAEQYFAAQGEAGYLVPPLEPDAYWTPQRLVAWWDVSAMLLLGGIPWNCYFQRVLSCQSPAKARWHSLGAGVLTILLTVPPLLLGMAAYVYLPDVRQAPAYALPQLLRDMTPYAVGLLGLGAIVGAVTSSFSSSILSAGGMFSWNVYRPLLAPAGAHQHLRLVIRLSIVLLGAGAVVMALHVQSVKELWFFSSDLVYVLLFPQLLAALFDPRANRAGSAVAFLVSLVLRLGGGEPLFGLKPFLPYADLLTPFLAGAPADWYDADGYLVTPFRTLAMLAGLLLLPMVSRLTAAWDPPRALREPALAGAATATVP